MLLPFVPKPELRDIVRVQDRLFPSELCFIIQVSSL